jgi:hypothetical protein
MDHDMEVVKDSPSLKSSLQVGLGEDLWKLGLEAAIALPSEEGKDVAAAVVAAVVAAVSEPGLAVMGECEEVYETAADTVELHTDCDMVVGRPADMDVNAVFDTLFDMVFDMVVPVGTPIHSKSELAASQPELVEAAKLARVWTEELLSEQLLSEQFLNEPPLICM